MRLELAQEPTAQPEPEITAMDRDGAKIVREILRSQLTPVLEKHGLTLDIGNATFDGDSVTFTKLRIAVTGALSETEKALAVYADRYGLDTTRIADVDDMQVSLVGYKVRARKRPFIIQDLQTSRQYVITFKRAMELFENRLHSWEDSIDEKGSKHDETR